MYSPERVALAVERLDAACTAQSHVPARDPRCGPVVAWVGNDVKREVRIDDIEVVLADASRLRSLASAARIDELDLDVRSYNALRNAGVWRVGVLLEMTEEDLGLVRNMGVKSVANVKKRLAEHGLALAATDGRSYAEKVNAPLGPETITAINKALASGNVPRFRRSAPKEVEA